MTPSNLSPRSICILNLIAQGHSMEQISKTHPQYGPEDVALAASEALVLNRNTLSREERMKKIQQRYARAYEKWTEEEERFIVDLYNEGKTMREIAVISQRQPNAVKSRLERLGLFQHRHLRPEDYL